MTVAPGVCYPSGVLPPKTTVVCWHCGRVLTDAGYGAATRVTLCGACHGDLSDEGMVEDHRSIQRALRPYSVAGTITGRLL